MKRIYWFWKNGDSFSKEYFFVENCGIIGFDQFLFGLGFFVWYIDDFIYGNIDENYLQVGFV